MYPMNGNISGHIGHVQSSRLALSRFAFKLHRQGIAWGTMGKKGLCGKYIMPIMKKQQYRFQATVPSPMVKGRWACPPIGASDMKPGSGNTYRSEEHTSELQSLMRTSSAVCCSNKTN